MKRPREPPKRTGGKIVRIGLIDVDGHNFPNIPLMKISAWHKQQGDTVEWYEPLFSGHMDKVYMSKVFGFTPDYQFCIDADKVVNKTLKECTYSRNWVSIRTSGYMTNSHSLKVTSQRNCKGGSIIG